MTPKPADFYNDRAVSDDSTDIEAGELPHPEPVLSAFNAQVEQIQTLITNARVAITSSEHGVTKQLEYAEKEVRGAFKQLEELAVNNHKYSCAPASRRAVGTMRIVHFTKCTEDILQVIGLLDAAWMKRHEALMIQLRNGQDEDEIQDPHAAITITDPEQFEQHTKLNEITHTVDELRALAQGVRTFGETQDAVLHTKEIGFADDFLLSNELELQTSLRKSRKKVILLIMIPLSLLVLVAVIGTCIATRSIRRKVTMR